MISAEVVLIGRANVDLMVQVPHRPSPGRTVFGSELVVSPGGKSLNQAVAVARLGGRACLVSNAGDDHWGQLLMSALTEAGVDASQFRLIADVSTGAALVEVTPDGENFLILALSRQTELTVAQVDDAMAHIDAPVVAVQLDLPAEVLTRVLTTSRRNAIRIGDLVPDPAFDRGLMRYLDVLVVNQHEAATILGVAQTDPLGAAASLRELGPTAVVVTAGAQGAAYSCDRLTEIVRAAAVPVTDTTGAGDAFLGSLTLDLARTVPLPTAVARAVAVGAEAVQHRGAQLPSRISARVYGGEPADGPRAD